MKKYIVFSLLCSLIGITYVQAPYYKNPLPSLPSKRAWACRNTRRPISKSTQLRLTKNKCTNAEIEASRLVAQTAVSLGVLYGVPAALVGAVAVGGAGAATVGLVHKKKLESKYGKNWRESCEKIVNDFEISEICRDECRDALARKSQEQLAREQRRLREGGEWSGVNPLHE